MQRSKRQLVTDKSLRSVWQWDMDTGVTKMTLSVQPTGKAILCIDSPDDEVQLSFNTPAIMRELAESLLKGANCIDRQKREARDAVI